MDQNTGRMADTTEAMQQHTKKLSDELVRDRVYIETITKQLQSMANSLEEFRQLAQALKNFLALLKTNKAPPGETPDLEDIIGPPTKNETSAKEEPKESST